MKGISPLISTVFIIAISMTAMVLVLRVGLPLLDKSSDFSNINEAENLLTVIDSAIKEISAEGEGSTRRISIKSSGGTYEIDTTNDVVLFTLESEYDVIAYNATFIEGPIFFNTTEPKTGSISTIKLQLNYTNIDFVNNTRWTRGSFLLLLENTNVTGNNATIETRLL